MSMAEATSSSNGLLPDDAERVHAGLQIQCLDFSHCGHFQRIRSGLDQSLRWHRVGPLTRDDCLNEHANRALATAPRISGVFIGESLQGDLELYNSEATGHVDVTLVVKRSWRNRGLGWALLCPPWNGCITQRRDHSYDLLARQFAYACARAQSKRATTLVFDEICACINVAGLNGPARKNGT